MWILFSILCMVVLTAVDIVGKKAVGEDELAPIKLRISVTTVSTIIGLLMYIFGLGESGLAPWILAMRHPFIFAAVLCASFSEFLYVFSLRYVGMTIMEAVSGFEGIVIFAGLLLIHLFFGELGAVREMLIPTRLILICIILVFTFLLPNVETILNKNSVVTTQMMKERRNIIIGILIGFIAVVFSVVDSLVADVILSGEKIDVVDFAMTCYFFSIIPLPIFCAIFFKKRKNAKSKQSIANRYTVIYAGLFIVYLFLGIIARSIDAVRSEVMYLTYPIISIIGARIVLKEKYTWKQNLCIWIIALSTIAFCVIDYII